MISNITYELPGCLASDVLVIVTYELPVVFGSR